MQLQKTLGRGQGSNDLESCSCSCTTEMVWCVFWRCLVVSGLAVSVEKMLGRHWYYSRERTTGLSETDFAVCYDLLFSLCRSHFLLYCSVFSECLWLCLTHNIFSRDQTWQLSFLALVLGRRSGLQSGSVRVCFSLKFYSLFFLLLFDSLYPAFVSRCFCFRFFLHCVFLSFLFFSIFSISLYLFSLCVFFSFFCSSFICSSFVSPLCVVCVFLLICASTCFFLFFVCCSCFYVLFFVLLFLFPPSSFFRLSVVFRNVFCRFEFFFFNHTFFCFCLFVPSFFNLFQLIPLFQFFLCFLQKFFYWNSL